MYLDRESYILKVNESSELSLARSHEMLADTEDSIRRFEIHAGLVRVR